MRVLAFLLCLVACGCKPPQPVEVPAKYVPRATESGVWIFEYDPGNQGSQSGSSLRLFLDAMQEWNNDNPDLRVIRLESIRTSANYVNTSGGRNTISTYHIMVYTAPDPKKKDK